MDSIIPFFQLNVISGTTFDEIAMPDRLPWRRPRHVWGEMPVYMRSQLLSHPQNFIDLLQLWIPTFLV